jgi:Zinc-binding dehydrogenase
MDRPAPQAGQQYVSDHTAGRGFDLVYDTVGGATLDASFNAVRRFGHVVSILGWGSHLTQSPSRKASIRRLPSRIRFPIRLLVPDSLRRRKPIQLGLDALISFPQESDDLLLYGRHPICKARHRHGKTARLQSYIRPVFAGDKTCWP